MARYGSPGHISSGQIAERRLSLRRVESPLPVNLFWVGSRKLIDVSVLLEIVAKHVIGQHCSDSVGESRIPPPLLGQNHSPATPGQRMQARPASSYLQIHLNLANLDEQDCFLVRRQGPIGMIRATGNWKPSSNVALWRSTRIPRQ